MDEKIQEYEHLHPDNNKASISHGTRGNGWLENGKLLPYYMDNATYFDESSYLNGRAFVNGRVKKLLQATYHDLAREFPRRKFYVMECSYKKGGKLTPHKTHQHGLSVDFQVPKVKNNHPYTQFDHLGLGHYLLDTDDNGFFWLDDRVSIDFEMCAKHILTMHKHARKYGLKIKMVILKLELKDEFFNTPSGRLVKKAGIYFARRLPENVNNMHDDHYHVDFEVI